jgi:hypothetical protein
MESLPDRFHRLEMRIHRLERQLRMAKVTGMVLTLVAASAFFGFRGEAEQPPVPAQASSVKAPFTVTGSNGATLLTIDEFYDKDRKEFDTLLTYYRNNAPAALFRTTGLTYKDAADPAMSFLNVFETWLYKYDKTPPSAYLVASTALTRAGGSIVVYNDQGSASSTPPFAARLTAKQGIGGRLVLFNPKGQEAKVIDP